MPKYEDYRSDGNKSAHSLDGELNGFDVAIMRTRGAKKAIVTTKSKLWCSTQEKNPVSRFD